MTMTSPLILLALLCYAVGCAAAGDKRFGCMYDQVAWNSSAMPARIVESGNSRGKVKGATMSADTERWEPIRFQFFTEDLITASQYCTASGQSRPTFIAPSQTVTCKPVDILTNEKINTLQSHIIPAALRLHSERILVKRVTGNIIVPGYTTGPCATFTIPPSHTTEGVSNADMIMYVAAGPTGYPKSWAGTCSAAEDTKRPVIGVINIGPSMIGTGDKVVRVVAHEIAHALGFNYQNMNSLNMVTKVPNIRGFDRLVVSSAATLEKAKAHYNCTQIRGMELENEGGSEMVFSHWERRNARDELMAGFGGIGYYTALTLSAFESMGYYRANWGMEETMEWGRNKGCPFLEEKCVTYGKTNFPDMFCTDASSTRVCTFDRRGLGRCRLGNTQFRLPEAFQYFSDSTTGGTSPLLDFCPIVVQYSTTGCKDGNVQDMPGSRVGPYSLCLKGEGLRMNNLRADAVQDICAEISCDSKSLSVRYAGDENWHECPKGSHITPKGSFSEGKILCPNYEEVCSSKHNITVSRRSVRINNNDYTVKDTSTFFMNYFVPSKRVITQPSGNSGTSTSTNAMSKNHPGERGNEDDAVRKDVSSDINLKSLTQPVSVNTDLESSSTPRVTGNNGASVGKLQSTTQPVAVKPIKQNSPQETDVKNSVGTLSASPLISGTKNVNPTRVKVDSSQFLSCWCGRFIPRCGGVLYISALFWAL